MCLVSILGCSTTSTIQRISAPSVEGDIVAGSEDSIFVDTDAQTGIEIPREDVSSIDYPGNVHRNAGIGVLAYGAINIAVGLDDCRERTENKGHSAQAYSHRPCSVSL